MPQIYICTFFLLLLPLFYCKDLSTKKVAYYHGRSADIILSPKNIQDSSILLLSNKNKIEDNVFEETSVADLISYLIGGPIVNSETPRHNFPFVSIFHKNLANLLFIIPGFGSEIIAEYKDQLKILQQHTNQYQLKKSSFPEDYVASLTSILTGETPSTHGIVGKKWPNRGGELTAFGSRALPAIANLPDYVSQTFQGRSLTLSMSSDFQMASALGTHQYLSSENPFWNNFGFFYNTKNGTFESIYSTNLYPSLTNSGKVLGNLSSLLLGDDSITVDGLNIVVHLQTRNLEAFFDGNSNEVVSFFGEMLFLRNMLLQLQTDTSLKSLVQDEYPDLFSTTFQGLQGIQTRYGKNSAQFSVALFILDQLLVDTVKGFSTIYDGRVSSEVIFLAPSVATTLNEEKTSESRYKVLHQVKAFMNMDIFDTYFPSLYLQAGTNREEVCNQLKAKNTFEVYCAEKSFSPFEHLLSNSTNSTTNGTVVYSDRDVAVFQIGIWFGGVGLILLVASVVYAMCSMDLGTDSLIYRTTNLKPHAS